MASLLPYSIGWSIHKLSQIERERTKLRNSERNECQRICSLVLNFCKSNNGMLSKTKEVNRMRIGYIWKYWNASPMYWCPWFIPGIDVLFLFFFIQPSYKFRIELLLSKNQLLYLLAFSIICLFSITVIVIFIISFLLLVSIICSLFSNSLKWMHRTLTFSISSYIKYVLSSVFLLKHCFNDIF